MRMVLIGGAAAALVMATAVASAQPAPPAPPGVALGTAPVPPVAPVPPAMHREMRVRFMSDHEMTRAEVPEHVAKLFAKLDTNRDGFITRQEVDALHARMETTMVKVGDAQKRAGDVQRRLADRGVFVADRGATFDRLDTNHDGNISRQEFMASRRQMREERVMIMHPEGAPGALPSMAGHPGMMMRMHRMGGIGMGGHLFEMADANRDGRVSLAEAQAAALAHFDKADANHDGKITPDERGQMRKVIRLERRQG